ncbi:hypothetical protein X801_00271 [Opisthorchis viverrini]|uniref:Uncharacterized protein n=1 Tax=Opisthorchis viverrini TaxID=6198 RepID=A0A1S8XBK6_OPIVI|nr:hypothetical protein X801_00271 [Opisthorchis viverrini]
MSQLDALLRLNVQCQLLAKRKFFGSALYSVLLAIRTPVFNWSSPLARKSEGYRLDDEVVSSLTKAQDGELRDRIRFGLEGILKSVGGFQRVINVKQLVTVAQHSPRDPLAGGLIYYRAQVVSVGHSSVQDPQDLIRHRLHEGHIPSLGYVDPSVSRIDLLESDVEATSQPIDFEWQTT